MSTETKPMVVINVFTPKPGALDDFLALQIAALPGLQADAGQYQLVYQTGDV